MIDGIVRQIGKDWFVEHRYALYTEPVLVGVRWHVKDIKRQGNTAFAPELADGLKVGYDDIGKTFSAYKDGGYLVLYTEHEGTEIPDEPITCPKVKKGIETRYQSGTWQKYSKREGWVTA